jgi:hypothetical protein
MQRRKPLSRQEAQLVLPIEKEDGENLPKLEAVIRHEVARLLRVLIAECVAVETRREDDENE